VAPAFQWFESRADALLKLADNLIGDILINVLFHWRASLLGLRMQPARLAPTSEGLAVKTSGADRRRATRGDYTPAFFDRFGLDRRFGL
jgi:hypothetical protein